MQLVGGGVKTLYKSDFSADAGTVFTDLYGEVEYLTASKTVLLHNNADNAGANTYFGEEDKNLDYQEGGLTVTAKFNLSKQTFNDDNGFNWSVAVNNQEGTYLSERSIYVRRYGENFKIGYEYNGSDDTINKIATSNETAVTVAEGWYTFEFNFHDENGEAKVTIKVSNANGEKVFEKLNADLNHSDLTMVNTDEVKGLRYGWLSWLNAAVECSEVSVTTNK